MPEKGFSKLEKRKEKKKQKREKKMFFKLRIHQTVTNKKIMKLNYCKY
jgi:hypothetical protein